MPDIAILIPSLNRAPALEALVRNINETTPEGAHSTLFILDIADRESREVVRGLPRCRYLLADGTFPVKINAGVMGTTEPLILSANDDVVFYPGWYEAATDAFEEKGVHVVGTDDLTPITRDRTHTTMPILRRSYVKGPGAAFNETGTVFHEGYHHNYCETELWQLACHRGVAKFAEECVIEHRHPNWGTAALDETYRKGGRSNVEQDRQTFERRKAAWEA
ncbi:MAG: glycosyltransferase [Deltaproteobacteria bacterium]|nr:glycosyltransferase [Deltaproteobacteria bacterium]